MFDLTRIQLRHGLLGRRGRRDVPIVGSAIGRRHPDRPHEQHAGATDRGEQLGDVALVLQLRHRRQLTM